MQHWQGFGEVFFFSALLCMIDKKGNPVCIVD